jgi:hypothetical protein
MRALSFPLCVCAAVAVHAQTPPTSPVSSSPKELAQRVMRTFESGTPEQFAAIYPDSAGRVFMREARGTRRSELAQVVWAGAHRAVLLLGGAVRGASTERTTSVGGNETNGARHFSGFYEAVEKNGNWTIARQVPFDSANYVRTQHLSVTLTPAVGLDVVDTLGLSVGVPYGIGLRLNNAAQLRDVRLDGAEVEHAFGGGVLWVKAPVKSRSRLVLSYSLAASRPARTGSDSLAAPAFGAFNNTDVWHPFFSYLSANDLADIAVTVRIPADYYLTTTLPQADTVRDGVRTVTARSLHNEFLLALIYDREWRPQTTDFGAFRFESFTAPSFRYTHDSLATLTKLVYDVLAPRFGEPQFPSRYLAAVQSRALGQGGFNVRMNNAAISGGGGGVVETRSSQTFAHETGHAWTMNGTGLGSNFLHEAWATFVEALMVRRLYTPDDERTFWEQQRNSYMVGNDRQGFAGGFEGQQSILANYDNGRIHYRKGVWILYSGNYAMGDSAFNRGMRLFIDGMGKGPSGYEELLAAWSKAAGHSMTSFVMPWLTSKYIPDVEARVEGDRLIVAQSQPGELFDLPKLEIELTTEAGATRKLVHLAHRSDTLRIGPISAGDVSRVVVDPDHRFLLQRHWGEHAVRFELPAATAGNATTVSLAGNFLRAAIPATKQGEAWVVEIPMTEGRYAWAWQVGDAAGPGRSGAADSLMSGTRTVRALERVSNAYPGR